MYQKKRNSQPATTEELLKIYNDLTKDNTRQHGKKLVLSDDPKIAHKQLYNAIASIKSRNKRKDLDKRREESYKKTVGFGADDADEYGIRPIDERRYLAKFKNCPIGAKVELPYMIRMTGLSLKQIYELQKRTGLKPYPAVTEKAANKDQKIRDEQGIYL